MISKRKNPEITVHPMRRKDAALVSNMMAALQKFHGDTYKSSAKQFSDNCFGSGKLADIWIASVGKKAVAFAMTRDWMNFVRGKPTRSLHLLYVKDGFRGQAVGAALVSFIARQGWEKGIRRLDTSASLKNPQANRFYQKMGFDKLGHYTQRYSIDGEALHTLTKKKTKQ